MAMTYKDLFKEFKEIARKFGYAPVRERSHTRGRGFIIDWEKEGSSLSLSHWEKTTNGESFSVYLDEKKVYSWNEFCWSGEINDDWDLSFFIEQIEARTICQEKNWVEGGSMDGFRQGIPTTYINVYEEGDIRVIETRVDYRPLGSDEVITYETEEISEGGE
tara:strand:- start:375 stop:860 length:486 start_codon:yes stop_codon:yes gene_type:complete